MAKWPFQRQRINEAIFSLFPYVNVCTGRVNYYLVMYPIIVRGHPIKRAKLRSLLQAALMAV
jgi:hypothetical protein